MDKNDFGITKPGHAPIDSKDLGQNSGSGMAMLCKVVAVIIVFIAFIAGIIAGQAGGLFSDDFNFYTAAIFWVAGFISWLALYSIGETLDKVASLHDVNTKHFYEIVKLLKHESDGEGTQSTEEPDRLCQSCGCNAPVGATLCQQCESTL